MDEHGGDEVCLCETLTDELAAARARLTDLEIENKRLRGENARYRRIEQLRRAERGKLRR